MKYKESTKQYGPLIKRVYKQENSELTNLKKGKVRQQINDSIFDPEDSIADNSKLIALVMMILVKLYNVGFDINQLSQEDRNMIDSWANLFANTTTRFSIQFDEEGEELFTKLFNRQQQIANYIPEAYSEEE